MRPNTKPKFNALLDHVVQQYQAIAEDVKGGKYFAITGPQSESFLNAVQARTPFLQKINMPLVHETQGEKVFAGTQQPITGRKQNARFRKRMGPDGNKYQTANTDSGIVIPWKTIDVWASMGDQFMAAYAQFVQLQIALDQIMIGWRGTSVAADTDPDTNKLLQDVNKGWMQWMRDFLPANIMDQGKEAGKISIYGDGADYANLDDLAYDLRQGLGEVHRERTDLVFMVGADLVAKESELVSKAHGLTPTERGAMRQYDLMGSFGGLPATICPNFPARGAVITTYDNLSIYTEDESMRRKIKDDDELMGVVDSYYREEAYVVEDETLFVGIEFDHVVLPGDAPPAP